IDAIHLKVELPREGKLHIHIVRIEDGDSVKNKFKRIWLLLTAIIVLSASILVGCGKSESQTVAEGNVLPQVTEAMQEPTQQPTEQPTQEPAQQPTEQPTETPTQEPAQQPTEQPTETPTQEPVQQPTQQPAEQPTQEPQEQKLSVQEDGYYYDLEHVVLYIDTYGKLPHNYISKKDAEALGWSGGSVDPYKKGGAIGGSKFGNYEGSLPEGAKYTECDIDTNGMSKRGAKRLVFSNNGRYFYTQDHYETFREVVVENGTVVIK
ncbi:MAG: hypothetical protein KBS85_08140, partial [Lachnospiraceae bacterium]|nr:hypothetical protein [Candidatus Merdinaster equi]